MALERCLDAAGSRCADALVGLKGLLQVHRGLAGVAVVEVAVAQRWIFGGMYFAPGLVLPSGP